MVRAQHKGLVHCTAFHNQTEHYYRNCSHHHTHADFATTKHRMCVKSAIFINMENKLIYKNKRTHDLQVAVIHSICGVIHSICCIIHPRLHWL